MPPGSTAFLVTPIVYASNNLVDLDGDTVPDDDTNNTYDVYRFPIP